MISGSRMRVISLVILFFLVTVIANSKLSLTRSEIVTALNPQMQLPTPQVSKKLSLGYQNFLASLFWIKTLAYYGAAPEKADYAYVQKLLLTVIELNPHAEHAYYLAASAIPWNSGSTYLSKPIVEKAMQQFPDDWHWSYYRGFNAYWFDHDYGEAARLFTLGAKIKGAPPLMTQLALRMQAETGQIDTAIGFLQQLIEENRDKNLSQQLLRQRNLLLTEKTLRQIDQLLTQLPHRYNDARDLQALHRLGYALPESLADGGSIVVQADGNVVSSTTHKRFRVFIPPKRQKPAMPPDQL